MGGLGAPGVTAQAWAMKGLILKQRDLASQWAYYIFLNASQSSGLNILTWTSPRSETLRLA